MIEYAAALALIGVIQGGLFGIGEFLEPYFGLGLMLPALMLIGWLCRTGPAMAALALAVISSMYTFIGPRGVIWPETTMDQVTLVVFLVLAIGTMGLARFARHSSIRAAVNAIEARDAAARLQRQIEERERIQSALEEREARLRALFDQAAVGIQQVSLDGTLLSANDKLCEIAGAPRESIVGGHVSRLTDPEDWAVEQPMFASLVSGRIPSYQIVKRYIRPGGERIWIRLTASMARGAAGEPLYRIGIVEDITEQKHAEEALRESEERFRTLADNAPVMIWTSGEVPGVDWANRLAIEFTGRRIDEMLGFAWRGLVHPDDVERITRLLQAARQQQTAARSEFRLRRADGVYRWVAGAALPRFLPDGRMVGLLGCVLDITEIVEARRALERDAAALTRSNEELDDFAHAVAHDLKEPLRSIRVVADFLEEDCGAALGEIGREHVERIRSLERGMWTLIDSLLEYAQVARMDRPAHPTPIAGLVDGAVEMLRQRLDEAGADVTVRTDPPLPVIACEPAAVARVFVNLISNAVKYNRAPRKTVEIGVVPAAPSAMGDERGPDVLYVRDNGVGIPDEARDKLFRIFRRLAGAESFGAGSGAGLAIVKKIVERHGGHIWFESEPGRGTTFYFTLEPDRSPLPQPLEPRLLPTPTVSVAAPASAAPAANTG